VVLESVCPARAGPLTKRHAPSRTGPKGLRCLDNPLLQPIAKLLRGWCDSSEASRAGQLPFGGRRSTYCRGRHRHRQRLCLTGVFVQSPRGSLFLLAEARRGALTVNSFGDGSWLSTVECDTTVVVEPSALRLLPSGWTAGLNQAQVWRTLRCGRTADPAGAQRPRIVHLLARISQPPSAEWMGCLEGWITQGSPLDGSRLVKGCNLRPSTTSSSRRLPFSERAPGGRPPARRRAMAEGQSSWPSLPG
jgi:hypothetical protein